MNPVNLLRFPERLMNKQTVEFSSHTANLALMRNCVRKFLNGYPFSERERLLMVLGVDEACTNVIRYAYRLRDDQLISLHLEGLRKCVRLRVRDYGEQVLPNQMKGRSHDMIKPGGLGLFLIRNAFDEVDYVHKRRGTELVLTHRGVPKDLIPETEENWREQYWSRIKAYLGR